MYGLGTGMGECGGVAVCVCVFFNKMFKEPNCPKHAAFAIKASRVGLY